MINIVKKAVKMARKWWKEAVVYQIYPRSFLDTNGDGIGDLQGIISKLDYIKALGANTIWLCPVYESPNADNGYDISDYESIMADYGTMADFEELLTQAHQRDMKIIMDLVVNHTSDKHPWFIESRKSKDNPYRDYYLWQDGKDGKAPNELESVFEGSAWQYDENTDMYYLHLYTPQQPDLNWENPKVRSEIFEMMTRWFERGIDGFRMDVINQIAKNWDLIDQYQPNKDVLVETISNQYPVHEYLKEMNRKVLSQYDVMTVGETGGVTTALAKEYAGFGKEELDMVFSFEHMSLDKGDMSKLEVIRAPLKPLREVLTRWQTELHGVAWNSLFFENHDRPRSVSKYGDDTTSFNHEKSAKMLAVLLYLMEGTPYIYQGQEIGMKNAYFDCIEDYDDVDTKNKYEKWKDQFDLDTILHYFGKRSRDNARTPMPWNDGANAGFTTGKPWLKLAHHYQTINVQNNLDDENSIYHFYQKVLKLRKEYDVLIEGKYELLLEDDEHIFSYQRVDSQQKVIVICNYDNVKTGFDIDLIKGANLVLSNYEDDQDTLLRPYEAKVYVIA